jgi:hypothetical protein
MQATPGPQEVPQPPQLRGSVLRFTHALVLVHSVRGGVHDGTHPVVAQPWPAAHLTLHAVQVAAPLRSASQPLVGSPSQSPQPGSQDPTMHAPLGEHAATA